MAKDKKRNAYDKPQLTHFRPSDEMTDEEWIESRLNELDKKVTAYEESATDCSVHRTISNAIGITNAKIAMISRLNQKQFGRFMKIQERFDKTVDKFEKECYCKRK